MALQPGGGSEDACLELAARGPGPVGGVQCRRERSGSFQHRLAESNALDKRLGELRLRADAGGPWARTFSERQQISNRHARAYDQTVSGLEIGLDRGWSASGGRWYAGGLLGYTYADRTYPGDGGGKVRACTSAATPPMSAMAATISTP